MTYKFGSKIEDVEDRLNEYLELVRRYDEANGTDPDPDQVKKACIISNTPEPLKTHLQLNVAKLGNFNALRVATEDYLRSRCIFMTTSAGNTDDEESTEVDAISRKGKGKGKSGKGKKGGKKGKESYSGKGDRETTVEHSRFEVSLETAESTDTKLLVQAAAQTSRQRQGHREVEIQSDRNQRK